MLQSSCGCMHEIFFFFKGPLLKTTQNCFQNFWDRKIDEIRFKPYVPDQQKSGIWGNLSKISHGFLRIEREDAILFSKF